MCRQLNESYVIESPLKRQINTLVFVITTAKEKLGILKHKHKHNNYIHFTPQLLSHFSR